MNPLVEASSGRSCHSGGPFQFSLTALLAVVVGVAVVGAFSSWGLPGTVLGLTLVGMAWTLMARRARAYRIAYYLTGGLQGVLLSCGFQDLVYFLPSPGGEVLNAAVFCLSALVTVYLLRNRIMASSMWSLWLAVFLAPYLVVLCLTPLVVVDVAIEKSGSFSLGELWAMSILIPFSAICTATVLLPALAPVSFFYCVWLRAIATPYEGENRSAVPDKTGDNRPDEAAEEAPGDPDAEEEAERSA